MYTMHTIQCQCVYSTGKLSYNTHICMQLTNPIETLNDHKLA